MDLSFYNQDKIDEITNSNFISMLFCLCCIEIKLNG
jgi:hypothetical protein